MRAVWRAPAALSAVLAASRSAWRRACRRRSLRVRGAWGAAGAAWADAPGPEAAVRVGTLGEAAAGPAERCAIGPIEAIEALAGPSASGMVSSTWPPPEPASAA